MFNEMIAALAEADSDPNINMLVLTGNGEYFSSGNDLNNYTPSGEENVDINEAIKKGCILCKFNLILCVFFKYFLFN